MGTERIRMCKTKGCKLAEKCLRKLKRVEDNQEYFKPELTANRECGYFWPL